jgi:acyl-CoA reductase-like NAD-dependent aldehyde dehydrogenase
MTILLETNVNNENQYQCFIDGQCTLGDGSAFPVINPATGERIALAPASTVSQVELAIRAAKRAQPTWAALPEEERKAYLRKAADVLTANSEALARLITQEQGKPLGGPGSGFEMQACVGWTQATASLDLPQEVVFEDDTRKDVVVRRPLGVVAAIAPWNWPVMIAIWQIMPSLRMGNTVVIKPSEYAPLATLEMVRLIGEVLPPGVLNAVSGDGAVGHALVSHPAINKIMFTGSERTGRKIVEASANNLARLTLELGGNDAAVVLDDVNPQQIAMDLFWGAFLNMGQTCACAKRLYVPAVLKDQIVEAMLQVMSQMPMGNGLEPGVMVGPIQNRMQFDKVVSLVEDAKAHGARVISAGAAPEGEGYFYPLTLVTDIQDGTRLVDEEQFGPVLPVITYDSLDAAIQKANALNLGLGASVWSSNPQRAMDVAARLEAGTVWINQHGVIHPMVPFGGIKGSGYGQEFGIEGLKAVSAAQVISLKKPSA